VLMGLFMEYTLSRISYSFEIWRKIFWSNYKKDGKNLLYKSVVQCKQITNHLIIHETVLPTLSHFLEVLIISMKLNILLSVVHLLRFLNSNLVEIQFFNWPMELFNSWKHFHLMISKIRKYSNFMWKHIF